MNVTYIDRDGNRIKVKGKVGDNLLYLAHRHGIEMEGKQLAWYLIMGGMAANTWKKSSVVYQSNTKAINRQ